MSLSIHHVSVILSQCGSKMRRARESGIVPHSLLKLLSPVMATLAICLSKLVSCIPRKEVAVVSLYMLCDKFFSQ